jgi:predicted small metal-binding protein
MQPKAAACVIVFHPGNPAKSRSGFQRDCTITNDWSDRAGRLWSEERKIPMKEFQCGSLVPGCDWHTRAEEEAEVMRRAVEHMRQTHGESVIRETMIEAIRSRIQKARDAA